jgi:hypothetical protein
LAFKGFSSKIAENYRDRCFLDSIGNFFLKPLSLNKRYQFFMFQQCCFKGTDLNLKNGCDKSLYVIAFRYVVDIQKD